MAHEQQFHEYLLNLPKISPTTIRIFERTDYYCVCGNDARLLAKDLFKTNSFMKTVKAGTEELDILNMSRANFVSALRYLLFVREYKVHVYQNDAPGRSQEWKISCKGSPGNFTQFEDFLCEYSDTLMSGSKGVVAIQVRRRGNDLVINLAYCDVMVMHFEVCQIVDSFDLPKLQSVLVQLGSKECLYNKNLEQDVKSKLENILKLHGILMTECKSGDFSTGDIHQDLKRLLKDETQITRIQGLNLTLPGESETNLSLSTVAVVIKHFEFLSDESNFKQFSLSVFESELYARIDIQTVKGLNLFPVTPEDNKSDSLFGILNKCRTAIGERFLRQLIQRPLMDTLKIEERLDFVEIFVKDTELRQEFFENHLRRIPDLELLIRRLQRRKATLQDLYKIYLMLKLLPHMVQSLLNYDGPHASILGQVTNEMKTVSKELRNFSEMIETTIDLNAIKEGEFIVKPGFDENLKEMHQDMAALRAGNQKFIDHANQELGKVVKFEFCKIIGYHFRLPKRDENILRKKKNFMLIDTKSSGIRFQTRDLQEINGKYLPLLKSYEELQKEIVAQIVEVADSYCQPLKRISEILAQLDVTVSLACVAVSAPKPYVRPVVKEKGETTIILKQVRHAILEMKTELDYIPNDIEIIKGQKMFYFVTGPNMGGKSTYIRSISLSVLMAQLGCFVPCDEAEISVVDAFMTRIGASDRPIEGVSTFMCEMIEMKNILDCATSNSLLVIDEMGRGTSTCDGFGLSWAVSWYIACRLKAPCLFATHFHELTEMSKQASSVGNLHVSALTSDNKITFLYRVKPGVLDQSYGIHVAEMANFPPSVIELAREKLKELDNEGALLNQLIGKTVTDSQGNQRDLKEYMKDLLDADGKADGKEKSVGKLKAVLNILTEMQNKEKDLS